MAQRNQVVSLFGLSPEQLIQQQQETRRAEIQAVDDPYRRTGMQIGQQLQGMFGGGQESPEVVQARQMQEALQGIDTSDSTQLRELAAVVKDFAPDRALQILDRASSLEKEARDIAMAEERLNLERRRVVTGERSQQSSENYQQAQLKMRQAGLDLESARFDFQRDQAGKLTPYQQTQVELAKQRISLQREQFDSLSPYQQRQLEFQEKQLEFSQKKYEDLSEKQQQELGMAEKRLRLSEAELFAKYTPDSVQAYVSSGGQSMLEPRPKASELPAPKAFSESLYNDFDAAATQAGIDIQAPTMSLSTDTDYRRAIYKRAFELKSNPKFRNLSDAEAIQIIIGAEQPAQEAEASGDSDNSSSQRDQEINAFRQNQSSSR